MLSEVTKNTKFSRGVYIATGLENLQYIRKQTLQNLFISGMISAFLSNLSQHVMLEGLACDTVQVTSCLPHGSMFSNPYQRFIKWNLILSVPFLQMMPLFNNYLDLFRLPNTPGRARQIIKLRKV